MLKIWIFNISIYWFKNIFKYVVLVSNFIKITENDLLIDIGTFNDIYKIFNFIRSYLEYLENKKL